MTHFLPPCCCTEAISRLPASSLCSIRQADGGVFVCSHWFPHTPCCQDTERHGRADSYICTLQDHCLARTLAWHVYMPETKAHGKIWVHAKSSAKLLHKWTLMHVLHAQVRSMCTHTATSAHMHAICATMSVALCTILSASHTGAVAHTKHDGTHSRTVHFAPCQCQCSPAYKWSEAAGLPSLTYFFSPPTPPPTFLLSLASLTLQGSIDVLLESIPAAPAINESRV